MRLGWVALIVAAATGADIATKAWARAVLEPAGPPVDLLPFLSLRLVFNEGVSFSLFAPSSDVGGLLIVGLTAILTLAAGAWAITSGEWQRVALALVTAGALGNLLDRLSRGSVTDFLMFHPGVALFVFNVADVWITTGVIALVLRQFAGSRGQDQQS